MLEAKKEELYQEVDELERDLKEQTTQLHLRYEEVEEYEGNWCFFIVKTRIPRMELMPTASRY